MFEISDRLQATKVSLPATNSQMNQFRTRWEQLHDDVKIYFKNNYLKENKFF